MGSLSGAYSRRHHIQLDLSMEISEEKRSSVINYPHVDLHLGEPEFIDLINGHNYGELIFHYGNADIGF